MRRLVHHEHGGLHRRGRRAQEVIRVAALRVAVDGRLAARVARVEDLEEVELAAARRPARAVGRAVLQGPRDLRVQHPDGGHVCVYGRGDRVVRHGEFEEEELRGAGEAVCFLGLCVSGCCCATRMNARGDLRWATVPLRE